ncbi:hypothetical protein B0H14DRAFT_3455169 [Mycena olivaceomarginata]|nr:hypothetical protein B0H14DRAFT_3455169 [Mycena olivaceomarginata]
MAKHPTTTAPIPFAKSDDAAAAAAPLLCSLGTPLRAARCVLYKVLGGKNEEGYGSGMAMTTTHSPPALVVLSHPSLQIRHVFPPAALAVSAPAVPHPPVLPAIRLPGSATSYFPTSPTNALHSPQANSTSFTFTHHLTNHTPTNPHLHALRPPPSVPRAPARCASPQTQAPPRSRAGAGRWAGFFSCSAPVASALAARMFSGAGARPSLRPSYLQLVLERGKRGAWIQVVDLAPLFGGGARGGGGVRDFHTFKAGRAPVGVLSFSCDGTKLFVPTAETTPAPAHLYVLHRGRTGTVVESLAGSRDGWFVALTTQRRTVHVFAVNLWLTQAELSTFSSAPRVLPRAIYLSHQFAFCTLGEGYHALIRMSKVSAFALDPGTGAGGEASAEGYGSSSPRAIPCRSRVSSSFDEPLQVRLPVRTTAMRARRLSMSVHTVAGLEVGVMEGLGRLRREMRHRRQKQLARSPPACKGGDDVKASVPLECDEEDEDFCGSAEWGGGVLAGACRSGEDNDVLSATTSPNGEDSIASRIVSLEVDGAVEGKWHRWALEDKLAVEEAEAECSDDISVVGFLDEEQAAMQAEATRRKATAGPQTCTKKRRNYI